MSGAGNRATSQSYVAIELTLFCGRTTEAELWARVAVYPVYLTAQLYRKDGPFNPLARCCGAEPAQGVMGVIMRTDGQL